ncbi:hypothetical protein D3C80_1550130 [compost metagenome]
MGRRWEDHQGCLLRGPIQELRDFFRQFGDTLLNMSVSQTFAGGLNRRIQHGGISYVSMRIIITIFNSLSIIIAIVIVIHTGMR